MATTNESALACTLPVLKAFRYFESDTLEATCAHLTRLLQGHRLEPGGAGISCRSSMDFLRFADVGFGSLRYGSEMSVEVTGLDDYYVVLFCLQGSAEIRTGDTVLSLDAARGFACNPGQTFRARFSPDCEQFLFRIERDALLAHAGEAGIRFRPLVEIDAIAPWMNLVRGTLADQGGVDLIRKDARITKEYERLLLSLFVSGQPRLREADEGCCGPLPRGVRDAVRFIEQHYDRAIMLPDIVAAAGVSTRTLLETFRHFRGTSPMKYLRDYRLDRARRLIADADDRRCLGEIARACGFTHRGRFSQDYRKRFGAQPSLGRRRAG